VCRQLNSSLKELTWVTGWGYLRVKTEVGVRSKHGGEFVRNMTGGFHILFLRNPRVSPSRKNRTDLGGTVKNRTKGMTGSAREERKKTIAIQRGQHPGRGYHKPRKRSLGGPPGFRGGYLNRVWGRGGVGSWRAMVVATN